MTEAPRRSRWFQFSLRTLLVLMLVVGAYFAGFATAQKLAEKAIQDAQDKAAAELESAQRAAMEAQERADLAAKYEAAFRAQTAIDYIRRVQEAVPINHVACIDLDAPTLPAEEVRIKGTIRWRVWCRHCKAWHYHGPAEGHREAHCQDSSSPYWRSEYNLATRQMLFSFNRLDGTDVVLIRSNSWR